MTKEDLIAAGLAEDLAEHVVLQIQTEVERRVSEEIKEVIAKRPQAEADVEAETEPQAEAEIKAVVEAEPQAKLNETLEELKLAHAKEMQEMRLSHVLEKAVGDAGAYHIDAVKPFLNMEGITLSADGTTQGLKEQLQALKNNVDTKFLFRDGEKGFQVKGAKIGESEATPEKAFDMSKATYSAIVKYLEENPDVKL